MTVTIKYKDLSKRCKCEKCGEPTNFSLNMCEQCFDNEVDNYYDGGREEDE